MGQRIESVGEGVAGEKGFAAGAGSRGLVMLLEELGESAPVAEGVSRDQGFELVRAGSIPALMRGLSERRPDLVLVDVGLADRATSKLVQYLAHGYPEVAFIAIADDRQAALLSVQAGARSALLKPLDGSALHKLVRAELAGSAPEVAGRA